MLLFQLEQGTDSFNVPGIFLLCATLAQMVVRDVEISGRLRRRSEIDSQVVQMDVARLVQQPIQIFQIGRASCRERV